MSNEQRIDRRELFQLGAAFSMAAIAHGILRPQEQSTNFIRDWTGEQKRVNTENGIKLVFISGINTDSRHDPTFK